MTHEFDGKKYEQASSHQKEWGSKLISELGLKGNERVLDLGCGDVSLATQLAELLPEGEVLGIVSGADIFWLGIIHNTQSEFYLDSGELDSGCFMEVFLS